MFTYDKQIDIDNWERIVTNGTKYGHKFPSKYNITQKDIAIAKGKALEFQNIWNKYKKTFEERIVIIYKHRLPKGCKFFVNTSPYSYFNVEQNYISISAKCKKNRIVPITIHEASHLLFKKYYSNYCKDIGCCEKEIDIIKELVTVITDDVFSPMQDGGWECHMQYRKQVLKAWKTSRDLNFVIKYSKELLNNSCHDLNV